MASIYKDADETPAFQNLRIVLLGTFGVGKSATGNAILRREAFNETQTRVSEIQRTRVDDRNISVIDTPGFFNTELTDEDLQNEMMKSLSLSYPGPHVFLLIINLQIVKEDDRNLVKLIQEIFEESLQFVMILFIGRENMSKREFTQFIENKKTEEMLNCVKGRYQVINSKNECDANQIKKLVKNIEKIVMENGGQCYSKEIKEQTEKRNHEEKIKQEELKKRRREILKQQEDRNGQKQEKKINQEEETERGDMRKQEDVRMKRRDAGTVKDTKHKHPDVLEDFRTQMESRKEKERLQSGLTPDVKSRQAFRIVLLGKTGAGKTFTGNTILGRDAFNESMFSTFISTCENQTAVVNGNTISVTDTPGLLDSRWYRHFKDDFERDIKACLELSVPGPHVFLLVIRLDGRATEMEKNTLKWIQENFGDEIIQHIIILFTHVDVLSDKPLDEYIRKNQDIQSLIKSCGGRYHSFNNEDRHNKDQVTQLLEKIEKLVKENGGKHYNNEMCLQAQRKLSDERTRIEEDMRPKETRMREEQKENQKQKNTQSEKEEKNLPCKEEEKDTQSEEKEKDSEEVEDDDSSTEDMRRELNELLTGQLTMLQMHLSHLTLMSLERRMTHINLPSQDLRIVLLGELGSGKSSAGNIILGRDAFRSSMLSTTKICEKQETVMNGKRVTVIDTPAQSQDYIESKIEKCVKMCAPGPHVFLLVIRLGMRFTDENQKTIKWIQKSFDEDAFNHTIVLFSWADLLNCLIDESLNEYIQKNNALQSLIDSCGGRYHAFNNTATTNRIQVIELLFKIDKMMQRNKGKHYNKHYISKTLNRKQADEASCEIQ